MNAHDAINAERSLLGCMLLNPNCIEHAVSRNLTHQLFSHSQHQHLCKIILTLHNDGQAVDVITVYERSKAAGTCDDIGGLEYITACSQAIASAGNWAQYLDIVKDRAQRRNLAEQLLSLADGVYEDVPVTELLARADAAISGLSYKTKINEPIKIAQAMKLAFDDIDAKLNGTYKPIYLGISTLDEKIGGVDRGDLIVIGAKPSHGKTAISLEIALGMAKNGYAVAMLQMEMSNKSLGYRVHSRLTGTPMLLLKSKPHAMKDADFDKIPRAWSVTDNMPFWLHDQPALSIEQITAYAKRIKKSDTGLDVLIIDHIHLTADMSGQKLRRDQELARVSGGLKRLAKESDLVVICLVQLNKGVEGRPKLKDIRECGAIEQDADIVMLNYYPYKDTEQEADKHTFDLDVAKARNGETGRVRLEFIGATQEVRDWPTAYDYQQQAAPSQSYSRKRGGLD
jgi:replicative DNA helicase